MEINQEESKLTYIISQIYRHIKSNGQKVFKTVRHNETGIYNPPRNRNQGKAVKDPCIR